MIDQPKPKLKSQGAKRGRDGFSIYKERMKLRRQHSNETSREEFGSKTLKKSNDGKRLK